MTELADRVNRWEHLFNAAAETSFMFLLDAEGVYLKVQTPDESRMWTDVESYIGKQLEDVLPPELAEVRRMFFDLAVRTRTKQTHAYPHPITKGRHMRFIINPLIVDGKVTEVLM